MIPMVEGTKEDTGFKGFGYTDEWCSNCENEVFNIPVDHTSLCPHCGVEIFPCNACTDKCDYDTSADGCSRFGFHKPELLERI